VRADERKIRQVVLNLLSNAIKFTPEGGRIEVAAMPRDGSVEISVSDTGIGIAPEDQEKVFEEFRQVGAAEKKAEGTGLGLTLCRKFTDRAGGRIWVKSQLGAGLDVHIPHPGTSWQVSANPAKPQADPPCSENLSLSRVVCRVSEPVKNPGVLWSPPITEITSK